MVNLLRNQVVNLTGICNFDTKLTKKEAEKILKRGLFFNGLDGEIEDGYFESSFEEGERWNKIYSDAYEWVKSKYEWLSS